MLGEHSDYKLSALKLQELGADEMAIEMPQNMCRLSIDRQSRYEGSDCVEAGWQQNPGSSRGSAGEKESQAEHANLVSC